MTIWLCYGLAFVVLVQAIVLAKQAMRRPGPTPLAQERFDERLDSVKGGLVHELGRTRAAVEEGMRDAGHSYLKAQDMLTQQIDAAVLRLRAELMDANVEGHRAAQNALHEVFTQARVVQERALADQGMMLRDLKCDYQTAIANLRSESAQGANRQVEQLRGMVDTLRSALQVQTGSGASDVTVNARLEPLARSIDALRHDVERLRATVTEVRNEVAGGAHSHHG